MHHEYTFICIGHRGAAGHRPENTLPSFAHAIELKVDMVELDVYNVQGQLVVIHDDRLERTTNGRGLVLSHDYDYIRSLDAGNGYQVPTLDEVFDLVNGRVGINIELKGPETAQAVALFIEQHPFPKDSSNAYLVSSFDHPQLKEFRKFDTTTEIGVLSEIFHPRLFDVSLELSAHSLNLPCSIINKQIVERCHQNGLEVFAYTVNEATEIERLKQCLANGVFTDYPDRVTACE